MTVTYFQIQISTAFCFMIMTKSCLTTSHEGLGSTSLCHQYTNYMIVWTVNLVVRKYWENIKYYTSKYMYEGYKTLFVFKNRFDNKSHKHYFRNFLPPPLIMLRHEKYTYIHTWFYLWTGFLRLLLPFKMGHILGLSLVFSFEIEKGRQNVYFTGAMSTTTHANMIIPLPLIILFLISTFYSRNVLFVWELRIKRLSTLGRQY